MLYICQGLPASGKDTFALQEIEKSKGRLKRLNKDLLRDMIDGGKWSKEREKNIIKVRNKLTEQWLLEGFDVIITDTNLNPKHIVDLAAIAKKCNSQYIIVDHFLDVSVRDCIKRDAGRSNPVGEKVITDMYFRYIDRKEKYLSSMAPNLLDAVIVDIDGTVAIHNGRSPYDLTRVKEDLPNLPLFRMLKALQESGIMILFVSGREGTVQCRRDTTEWLMSHTSGGFILYMRMEQDLRKDSIIKREIFENKIQDAYNILFVLDDRDQTVDTWRSLGLQCWQVGYGGF